MSQHEVLALLALMAVRPRLLASMALLLGNAVSVYSCSCSATRGARAIGHCNKEKGLVAHRQQTLDEAAWLRLLTSRQATSLPASWSNHGESAGD